MRSFLLYIDLKSRFQSKLAFLFILVFNIFVSNQFLYAQNCSVNAGISKNICSNEMLFLQGSFTPPLQSGAQVLWTQIGGPSATIVNPSDLNTEVINLLPGSYTFRLYTTCADGALTFQDVTHTVRSITFANAGPDATVCPGSYNLAANTPGSGESGAWTIVSAQNYGISVNNVSNPNSPITVNGSSSGNAILRWTITNPNGCSSYDEVVITNRGGISPVDAGANQVLNNCYSSFQSTLLNATFGGTNIDGQQGTWSFVSGPSVTGFSNIHSNTSGVSGLVQGTYVLRWTVAGPCVNGSDDVTITVPPPTSDNTTATIAGGNQVFCDPTTVSTVISGSAPIYSGETVTWQQIAGPVSTIVSPNSPVTTVNGLLSPNSYTYRYTITNPVTGCTSSATVSISFLPNPPSFAITTVSPVIINCGVSSAVINYIAGGSGTTEYRIVSGPAGHSAPTDWTNTSGSPITIEGLNQPGTYLIQFRRYSTIGAAAACGTVYDEITVINSTVPEGANAGTGQFLNCNVTNTTLIGNVPGTGQTGTWSQVSGPIVIILTDPNSPTLAIDGLTAEGTYVFRWVVSGEVLPVQQCSKMFG
ncbi:MAG: hypothetical protein IPH57_13545 [Saprospiraceae bacterium]|nr:hypothetical protein [Saprospiraceae bacterium]